MFLKIFIVDKDEFDTIYNPKLNSCKETLDWSNIKGVYMFLKLFFCEFLSISNSKLMKIFFFPSDTMSIIAKTMTIIFTFFLLSVCYKMLAQLDSQPNTQTLIYVDSLFYLFYPPPKFYPHFG